MQTTGSYESDLGLLTVVNGRLFWLDGSASVYERTSADWTRRAAFMPTGDNLPDDPIPRALVAI